LTGDSPSQIGENGVALNASLIQENIDEYGWHVVMVPEDDLGPGFAYSIGLYKNWKHPEIIMFGLPIDILHRAINNAGEEVRLGKRFEDSDHSDEIFEGYPVAFRQVSPENYDEYLGQAIRYYGEESFPVLQGFWSDKRGHYPWDSDFSVEFREFQPALQ
jgi:Domain of unknown function (DUF4262)